MTHFFLPGEIWKLIERKLKLSSQRNILMENYPSSFINFLINKCQNGEEFEFEYFKGEESADYDLYYSAYHAAYRNIEEKNKIPADKQTEMLGIFTKMSFEEGEFKAAIEYAISWEEKLFEDIAAKKDYENNLRRVSESYYIRMASCHFLGYSVNGYFEKAILEYNSFLNLKERTDQMEHLLKIYIEAAEIYLSMEDYENTRKIGEMLLEKGIYYGAILLFKIGQKQKDANSVVNYGKMCIEYVPSYVAAYEELCLLYRQFEEKEEWNAVIEKAKENEISTPFLTAYEYQLSHENRTITSENIDEVLENFRKEYTNKIIYQGRDDLYEKGYQILTDYINQLPCLYLLNERGLYSMDTWHLEEAKEDFRQMLIETYRKTNHFQEMRKELEYCGKLLQKEKPKWVVKIIRGIYKIKEDNYNQELNYYRDSTWYELLDGSPQKAVNLIRQWEKSLQKGIIDNRVNIDKVQGYYEDMLFFLLSLEELLEYERRHNKRNALLEKNEAAMLAYYARFEKAQEKGKCKKCSYHICLDLNFAKIVMLNYNGEKVAYKKFCEDFFERAPYASEVKMKLRLME